MFSGVDCELLASAALIDETHCHDLARSGRSCPVLQWPAARPGPSLGLWPA
jgi:hypothetical protein